MLIETELQRANGAGGFEASCLVTVTTDGGACAEIAADHAVLPDPLLYDHEPRAVLTINDECAGVYDTLPEAWAELDRWARSECPRIVLPELVRDALTRAPQNAPSAEWVLRLVRVVEQDTDEEPHDLRAVQLRVHMSDDLYSARLEATASGTAWSLSACGFVHRGLALNPSLAYAALVGHLPEQGRGTEAILAALHSELRPWLADGTAIP